ncbi:MAG: NAD(P)H-binding protein [Deltaproteobacteria bacterium]|nr:NAD(P)H-binding protein [Deltaproteobacteria bacterium]
MTYGEGGPIPSRVSDAKPSLLLLGSTGLVGAAFARLAVASGRYGTVRALVRRPSAPTPQGLEEHVVDLEGLLEPSSPLARQFEVEHVFCCLGTTIKVAGTKERFRRVDYEYPLAAAKLALAAGARRYVVVTAVGADAASPIFYNHVKGELEAALRELAFPEGVVVLHPSLLLGDRREQRTGEAIASVLMRATRPLFAGPLERYRAIRDEEVARAMLNAAFEPNAGTRVLEGRDLFRLATR